MPKVQGLCVCCGTTGPCYWRPVNEQTRPYVKEKLVEKARAQKRAANKLCPNCHVRLNRPGPGVKKSDILGAGNGLFADRDYAWGETVTFYSGKVYANRKDVPPNRDYVLFRGGFYIDGRVNFGEDNKGRYINSAKGLTKKPNVYFGNIGIGFSVPIKVITRARATQLGISKTRKIGVKKGEEFIISYGNGYWKRSK